MAGRNSGAVPDRDTAPGRHRQHTPHRPDTEPGGRVAPVPPNDETCAAVRETRRRFEQGTRTALQPHGPRRTPSEYEKGDPT